MNTGILHFTICHIFKNGSINRGNVDVLEIEERELQWRTNGDGVHLFFVVNRALQLLDKAFLFISKEKFLIKSFRCIY